MLIKAAPATLAPINTFIPTLASSGHKLEMITPYLPLSKEFLMSLTSTWDPGTLKMPCCWSPKRNKQKEEEEMPWTHQATGNMDDSPHCLSLSPIILCKSHSQWPSPNRSPKRAFKTNFSWSKFSATFCFICLWPLVQAWKKQEIYINTGPVNNFHFNSQVSSIK